MHCAMSKPKHHKKTESANSFTLFKHGSNSAILRFVSRNEVGLPFFE